MVEAVGELCHVQQCAQVCLSAQRCGAQSGHHCLVTILTGQTTRTQESVCTSSCQAFHYLRCSCIRHLSSPQGHGPVMSACWSQQVTRLFGWQLMHGALRCGAAVVPWCPADSSGATAVGCVLPRALVCGCAARAGRGLCAWRLPASPTFSCTALLSGRRWSGCEPCGHALPRAAPQCRWTRGY